MYNLKEIDLSREYLNKISNNIKEKIVLLGGWAVYDIVNTNFYKEKGRYYIGSRDIDIGFHIDKNWNKKQLKNSNFSRIIKFLEKDGFRWQAYRLFKDFDEKTLKELTPEESSKKSLFEITRIYVDPIIDNIHSQFNVVFRYSPIDEPLLSIAYRYNRFKKSTLHNNVLLCEPHLLLAMKLNCVEIRSEKDKRIKDISDIYALMWYSDIPLDELKIATRIISNKNKIKDTILNFKKEEIEKASENIGVKPDEIQRVFLTFVK
jgi:hypothetical protein